MRILNWLQNISWPFVARLTHEAEIRRERSVSYTANATRDLAVAAREKWEARAALAEARVVSCEEANTKLVEEHQIEISHIERELLNARIDHPMTTVCDTIHRLRSALEDRAQAIPAYIKVGLQAAHVLNSELRLADGKQLMRLDDYVRPHDLKLGGVHVIGDPEVGAREVRVFLK